MIIVLKPGTEREEAAPLFAVLDGLGASIQEIAGDAARIFVITGDTAAIREASVDCFPFVDSVTRIRKPYRLSGREVCPGGGVFTIAGRTVGGGGFTLMAGPCSVESEDQIVTVARDVMAAGADFLRGGAFKPRTSPYAFPGLGPDGLELLKTARRETGLPIVTEITSPEYLEYFERDVDIIQIGARNMQNFALLRQIGALKKPVLLKRGLSSTIDEWLLAAEHVMAGGTSQVILCERGIRTFETATRSTLDLSSVPVLRDLTHLPVIVDPSHATGHWQWVEPMALAAAACGADGLIVEVHNRPEQALCDGAQSITPRMFGGLARKITRVRAALCDDAI